MVDLEKLALHERINDQSPAPYWKSEDYQLFGRDVSAIIDAYSQDPKGVDPEYVLGLIRAKSREHL